MVWVRLLSFLSALPFAHAMASRHALNGSITVGTPRIAVIGGGAAGLACARVFSRDESAPMDPVVFEKDKVDIGGVWNYQEGDKLRPMYRGLRTNLPKEIMAYREFPWPPDSDSFLTHRAVHNYLKEYQTKFGIQVLRGCEVKHLRVLSEDDEPSCFSPSSERWPKLELTVGSDGESDEATHCFDAVLVANGHFSRPSRPKIPGLEYFERKENRRWLHAIEYDTPDQFRGQTVLCIGGRASGSDIAREIAAAGADSVYLSDSGRTTGEPRKLGQIIWVPRTTQITEEGSVQFDSDCSIEAKDVDVIIFCTGYDYSFPFVDEDSGIELLSSDRRVAPLVEQLWHAQYPNIAFVGLPHSIIPFPFFEFQAEACLNMWKTGGIPPLAERLRLSERDAEAGGEGKSDGRIKDTHYLGSAQWDYCRRMAKYAGVYNDELESYLQVNKGIWDTSSLERKGEFPGGPDDYRQTIFHRDHAAQSFQVVASVVQHKLSDGS